MRILYPWKMIGRYADNTEVTVSGNTEEDCMCMLADLTEKHGDLTWYSGVTDEDYVSGEYIGRDNFVYS